KKTGLKDAEQFDSFTLFTKDGKHRTHEMLQMINKAKRLYKVLNANHLYMSVTNNKVYFAYESKSIPKRQHKCECAQFERLYKQFLKMIEVVDIIKEEDGYTQYSN
ncbi:MAG: hypothetical protein ACOC1L_06575, partial [Bacillota bacterium]